MADPAERVEAQQAEEAHQAQVDHQQLVQNRGQGVGALEGSVACQSMGQRLADVVEGDGSQQWGCVAHKNNDHEDLENGLSEVNLQKKSDDDTK